MSKGYEFVNIVKLINHLLSLCYSSAKNISSILIISGYYKYLFSKISSKSMKKSQYKLRFAINYIFWTLLLQTTPMFNPIICWKTKSQIKIPKWPEIYKKLEATFSKLCSIKP